MICQQRSKKDLALKGLALFQFQMLVGVIFFFLCFITLILGKHFFKFSNTICFFFFNCFFPSCLFFFPVLISFESGVLKLVSSFFSPN
jgi:hypothetical protein